PRVPRHALRLHGPLGRDRERIDPSAQHVSEEKRQRIVFEDFAAAVDEEVLLDARHPRSRGDRPLFGSGKSSRVHRDGVNAIPLFAQKDRAVGGIETTGKGDAHDRRAVFHEAAAWSGVYGTSRPSPWRESSWRGGGRGRRGWRRGSRSSRAQY